ncbi:MAG: conjugative coupling factor TraD, PFGI-1 class, partial [Gammaproteobacteria bacterium]|nr:conjugative coupling factor TraD, PFGI-1 class [Gammaproteobacteria bacterium]
MSQRYPVEALLRPPVELWSAAVAMAVAATLAVSPGMFLVGQAVGHIGAVPLMLLALLRARQGWAIVRYHRGLTRLPRYALASRKIPVSRRGLFLGRGFAWGQMHVQRLRDLRRRDARPYLIPGRLFRAARYIETHWERRWGLSWLAFLVSRDVWWNPVRPEPAVGGRPELHAVGMPEGEHDVYMPLAERVGHTLVLGTTRVGKTRLA